MSWQTMTGSRSANSPAASAAEHGDVVGVGVVGDRVVVNGVVGGGASVVPGVVVCVVVRVVLLPARRASMAAWPRSRFRPPATAAVTACCWTAPGGLVAWTANDAVPAWAAPTPTGVTWALGGGVAATTAAAAAAAAVQQVYSQLDWTYVYVHIDCPAQSSHAHVDISFGLALRQLPLLPPGAPIVGGVGAWAAAWTEASAAMCGSASAYGLCPAKIVRKRRKVGSEVSEGVWANQVSRRRNRHKR